MFIGYMVVALCFYKPISTLCAILKISVLFTSQDLSWYLFYTSRCPLPSIYLNASSIWGKAMEMSTTPSVLLLLFLNICRSMPESVQGSTNNVRTYLCVPHSLLFCFKQWMMAWIHHIISPVFCFRQWMMAWVYHILLCFMFKAVNDCLSLPHCLVLFQAVNDCLSLPSAPSWSVHTDPFSQWQDNTMGSCAGVMGLPALYPARVSEGSAFSGTTYRTSRHLSPLPAHSRHSPLPGYKV